MVQLIYQSINQKATEHLPGLGIWASLAKINNCIVFQRAALCISLKKLLLPIVYDTVLYCTAF